MIITRKMSEHLRFVVDLLDYGRELAHQWCI